jgi:nitrite reductase/ring-hydroxylating ferredoxin subunit
MLGGTELTGVDDVPERGSFLFSVRDVHGNRDEAILVRCGDPAAAPEEGAVADGPNGVGSDADGGGSGPSGVEAWINRCPHEDQRLDTGRGAAMRDGQVICPKHGSMFDSCSGYCDNGEARRTELVPLEVEIEDGVVFLTDDDYRFVSEGGLDDDGDGGPSSTSHLSF